LVWRTAGDERRQGVVWAGGGKTVGDLLVLSATTAGVLVIAFDQRSRGLGLGSLERLSVFFLLLFFDRK
jgi:hypothetical protein